MKKTINKITLPALLAIVILAGCDKHKPYDLVKPGASVHFIGSKNQSLSVVTNPAPAYTITLGTTDVSDQDRTATINVTSPTGAAVGTQFTISATTVTIPKGQATATFSITPNYASYTTGRKDVIVFTLKEPSIKVAGFSDSVKLSLRGPCFEGEIATDVTALQGSYPNSNENGPGGPYGPYTVTATNFALTAPGATTATFKVNNVYDAGWNPITFTADWTAVATPKVTLLQQSGIGDAGTLSAAYAGMDITVRPHSNGTVGTYSYCSQQINIYMQLGVTGVGFFGTAYTLAMRR